MIETLTVDGETTVLNVDPTPDNMDELFLYLRVLKEHLPDMAIIDILWFVGKYAYPSVLTAGKPRSKYDDSMMLHACRRYCKDKHLS